MSLQIMVGIPGSGKSTIARNLLRDGEVDVIVCPDSVREVMIASRGRIGDPYFQAELEPEVWAHVFFEVEKELAAKKTVLVDATNLTSKSRYRWIAIANKLGITDLTAHFVQTPFEECLIRNGLRERVVPMEVMLQMKNDASSVSEFQLEWEGFKVIQYGNSLYK